jgi:glycosyltransferase involved in cell wall biosynthesis
VRFKPISRLTKYLPFKFLRAFDESNVIDMSDLPENVEVIKTPVWYFPFGFMNRFVGGSHFRSVDRIIKRKNIKFDIVHSHFVWSSGYVGMKLKEKYKVPLVVTGHGFDVYKLPFKNEFWKKKTKEILEKVDYITTVSQFNRNCLEEIGIRRSKINIIANGYTADIFAPADKKLARKELGIDSHSKVLLSVGNLEKIKGYDLLIKSIDKIKGDYSDLKVYILGSGSQYKQLKKLISVLGLESIVFLMGAKPHDQISKWMNASDLFIISSRVESFSVVLLESLACGVPVVGTKVGVIPEVLSPDSGFVVETNNIEQLSQAIDRALKNNWNSKKIVKVAEGYSWDSIVREYINLYNRLV